MSINPYTRKLSLLALAVSGAVGAMALVGVMPSAYAAAAEEDELEEVVVTGSRIVRKDFESNSPIVTVEAADFETQTGLNVESYLNQLPEYNPAASPTTTQGDVQITPVNSVGIASISLRGFGANRSLVLVNGKRPVPINPLMVTDVNGIPSALLQRVETITGGASAVYGADAVAGVTNFILRNNFEGFEFDTQYGVTDDGGADEARISMIFGANLADGRGNVTMGVERYNRDALRQVDNDFNREFQLNPYTGGTFGLQGINGYACNLNCPPNSTIEGMFSKRPAGTNVFSPLQVNANNRSYNFNSDGTIFVAGSAGGLSRYKGPTNDGEYLPQITLDGSIPPGDKTLNNIKWYSQDAFTSAPQERYSFFTNANFDINDQVNVYARGTFAESKTKTVLFGTSVITGWETTIPYNPTTDSPVDPNLNYADPAVVASVIANPGAFRNPSFIPTGSPTAQFPVPAELAVLLNARPNKSGPWQPQWQPDNSLPPRNTYNTNGVWQVEIGANIDLPFRDWTAELYASHGESATANIATGNLSLARTRLLTNQRDYGRGAKGTGNLSYVVGGQNFPTPRPAFGAGDYTCTSGFYDTFFGGDKPLSTDCYNAIAANLQTRTQNKQDIIELNLQGSLMDLPAGEVRVAAGYQNRRNSAKFYPDILQSQDSFTDQVIGVYPTGYLDAGLSVDDYYVEALVPVVNDLPFVQRLELELGYRYSDYEVVDAETTWKLLANWEVNDKVRVRGGYNRATRAPNIGEMFLNVQEIFTSGGTFGEACGLRSTAPFGAGGALPDPVLNPGEPQTALAPGQTAAGARSTLLICQELMGGANSIASRQFYTVANATGQSGGGFAWVQQKGNLALQSETADTYTFGAVIRSPWENPWLSGMTLSLDAYRIEIADAITQYSLDYAGFRCFGEKLVTTAAEAKAQAATEACQLLPRDQVNGAPLTSLISYDNQATIETQGFDIALNWFGELEELVNLPGRLSASVQATVLDYYRTKNSPAFYDIEIDWAGSLGPNLAGTNGGAYDYRLFSNLTYMKDDWSVGLRWRYLPGVFTAGYANQMAVRANNARVAAGGQGITLGYVPTTEVETGDYSIFDLNANWNVSETISVRAGINNLFDSSPEWVGPSRGYGPGTTLSGVCAAQGSNPGCINPAGFSLQGVGTINGGYYDVLGRRYFLGIKANF